MQRTMLRGVALAVFLTLSAFGGDKAAVGATNTAPVVSNATLQTVEDTAGTVSIDATDADGDSLTTSILVAPTKGTVSVSGNGPFQFAYTPSRDVNGSDTFEFQVSDGNGGTANGVIAVTIQAVNDNPIVVGEDVIWPLNATSTIDVLANDSDVEGNALTLELVDQPPGASATVNGAEISVTPAAGMSGPTHVEYRVTDAEGGAATGRVRVIFGSMTPIVYGVEERGMTVRVVRYDYFSKRTFNTPVPPNTTERFSGFGTNADATRMVYGTILPVPPFPRRLWLKDLTDDSVPVQEIETGGGVPLSLLANSMAISPDGNHIAFSDKYVHASRPGQPITIAPGAERPSFSRDGQYLFYVTVSPSGARAIHRAQIDPVLGPTNHVQVTATYPPGEGLGLDYELTADETKIVSTGSFFVPSLGTTKPAAYVSPVNGPVNDVRLHPQLSASNDAVEQPEVTANGRYAFYLATLGGTAGLYTTDLQSPGTAVQIAVNPNSYTWVGEYASSADSATLFHSMIENLHKRTWYYTSLTQPGVSTPFTPLGSSQAQIYKLYPAPKGSHVLFTVADALYSTTAPYTSATPLLPTNGSSSLSEARYAPDSNTVIVDRQTTGESERIYVVNPRAPGWVDRADAGEDTGCALFAGSGCW